jgi:hypothetical protein
LAEQVGVNAPGTENSATFLPLKKSLDWIASGPLSVAFISLTSGSLSPTAMVMRGSFPERVESLAGL